MSREAMKLALEALDKHDYEMADYILWKALEQPKREWKGLTDQDVHECFNLAEWTHNLDFRRDPEAWCKAFASEVEQTLKARNT